MVIAESTKKRERLQHLPLGITVSGQPLEIRRDVLLERNGQRGSKIGQIFLSVLSVELSELRARAIDKRPGINLRDVLQLGAVDFQFTAIVLVHTRQERAGDGAVSRCLRKHQDRLVRIRNLDAVLQATRQEERVLARAPLVVIAGQQQWLLVFLEPISGTEKGR